MPDSFGARLRQRREERQIALIAIAEQTKIKLSLLEALERDDVRQWPAGIFRRAFIRAYAVAIGLDPDVVVREFLEVHPEPAEVDIAAAELARRSEGGQANAAPPIRLRHIVGSAIGSLARLRRGAGAEDLVVGGPVQMEVQAADDTGVAIAADAPAEAVRGDGAEDAGEARALTAPDPPAPITSAEPGPVDLDLPAVAHLCTEFGRVDDAGALQPLLRQAAEVLGASGLVVWVWDAIAAELRPALAHGYSNEVLAQLPPVRRDADNATAAAFRSAQTCAIDGTGDSSGALAVPLLIPGGCAGVLAIELQHGSPRTPAVRAVATIFAASLAQMTGAACAAEAGPTVDDACAERHGQPDAAHGERRRMPA